MSNASCGARCAALLQNGVSARMLARRAIARVVIKRDKVVRLNFAQRVFFVQHDATKRSIGTKCKHRNDQTL